jgi:hypothetical protein
VAARFFCKRFFGIAHALRRRRFFGFFHLGEILFTPLAVTFRLILSSFFTLLRRTKFLISQPPSPDPGSFDAGGGTIPATMMFRLKTPLTAFQQAQSGWKPSLANLHSWLLWRIV